MTGEILTRKLERSILLDYVLDICYKTEGIPFGNVRLEFGDRVAVSEVQGLRVEGPP